MSLARQPRFDPDDDGPDPLPDGRLTPPPRKPPTAIATATPPPPHSNYHPTRYGTGITTLRRVARAAFGSCLVTAGFAGVYFAPLGLMTLASALAASGGALVMARAIVAPSIYRSSARRRRGRRAR
jgi:hypothetical protein